MNNRVKLGILIAVLVVIAVGAFSFYNNKQTNPEKNFVIEKQVNLSDADRKVYEDRVNDANSKLENEKDSAIRFDLYSKLGFAEYALGHLGLSKDAFNNAIKINADQYGVWQGLFQTKADMGDNAGADEAIKKAIAIRPNSAEFWKQYIAFKKDKEHASNDEINGLYIEALQKTQTLLTSYVDIHTAYASWLESVGNLQASKEYWQKAINLNPDNKKQYQAEVDRLNKLLGASQ